MSTFKHSAFSRASKSKLKNGLTVALERVLPKHWVQTVSAKWSMPSDFSGYVHLCYIDNQQTLFHSKSLSHSNPALYRDLQAYANQQGYQLLPDRRQQDKAVLQDRRCRRLPLLTLTLGLSLGVQADNHHDLVVERSLALFDASRAVVIETPPLVTGEAQISQYDFQHSTTLDDIVVPDPLAESISEILLKHYSVAANDPDYFRTDLKAMAQYFSRYPEAASLITALRDHSWTLSYQKNTFATQVRGNRLQVKAVEVNLDSRAAAQLRSHRSCRDIEQRGACIASPADALLHELLHVKSALLDSAEFIKQGGTNSVLYPYEHEAQVIKSENSLYRSMSMNDGRYRPDRHNHSGRLVASSCVTCIK